MAGLVDVLLGVPGAGKTEQANRLAASHRYVHLSTGQLLRAVADEATQQLIASGELVPSDQVQQLLLSRLEEIDLDLPVLLDGFPREPGEAQWLDHALQKLGRRLGHVIYLNLPQTEAQARLAKRGRPDDTAEALAERWREFHHQTAPLIKTYRHSGQLVEIDGSGSPEAVAARIAAAL